MTETFAITVEKNTEDPEIGGFFAYSTGDLHNFPDMQRWMLPRGFGHSETEAAACYLAVHALNEGERWPLESPFITG